MVTSVHSALKTLQEDLILRITLKVSIQMLILSDVPAVVSLSQEKIIVKNTDSTNMVIPSMSVEHAVRSLKLNGHYLNTWGLAMFVISNACTV